MSRQDFNGDGYSIDAIYSGSQDEHGHSVNLRCHVPKTWLGPLNALVGSPEWPEYANIQAILRDALYHRLHWANGQKERGDVPGVERAMAIMRFENERTRAASVMEEAEKLERDIDQTVLSLIQAGDFDSARTLLDQFEDTVRASFVDPHLMRLVDTIERLRKRAWR